MSYCPGCGVKYDDRPKWGRICSPCNKKRDLANAAVSRAMKRGKLATLPDGRKCADCDAEATIWEHRDYREYLKVDPVCARCNRKRGPGLRGYYAA